MFSTYPEAGVVTTVSKGKNVFYQEGGGRLLPFKPWSAIPVLLTYLLFDNRFIFLVTTLFVSNNARKSTLLLTILNVLIKCCVFIVLAWLAAVVIIQRVYFYILLWLEIVDQKSFGVIWETQGSEKLGEVLHFRVEVVVELLAGDLSSAQLEANLFEVEAGLRFGTVAIAFKKLLPFSWVEIGVLTTSADTTAKISEALRAWT